MRADPLHACKPALAERAALRRIDDIAKWELRTALERVQPHKYYVIVVIEASA
ncbi:MAG TPA: hypothetical protein VIC29_17840 [Steroidobacteraceae bacterium]